MSVRNSKISANVDTGRRTLIKSAALLPLATPLHSLAQTATRPLPIPPMLDGTNPESGRTKLRLQDGRHDFGTGFKNRTKGINQSYLGPVVRVRKDTPFTVDVANDLNESMACHWHGLHIEGQYDGGPHQEIAPGTVWSPDVPIAQRAGMSWFHSHTHGVTARQVYQGLAGVMLIDDDDSLAADLPNTYGVDDFVIVLQDKLFDTMGQMAYPINADTVEMGFQGDTLVINGVIAPVEQVVPKGLVRLRLLNSCNARFLNLTLSDGLLNVIASDGGFLEKTVQTDSLLMSPGERYEVLVDMRSVSSLSLEASFDEDEISFSGLFNRLLGRKTASAVLTLKAGADKGMDASIPQLLASMEAPDRNTAKVTRSFNLNMEGGNDNQLALAVSWGNVCANPEMGMGINGLPMKMDEINEECILGQTEIWRVNSDADRHPFHIHGCSFRILSQQGVEPPDYAKGWKDMVYAQDGWSEVLIRFDYKATKQYPYMYHCHILEHEDCGMMGQFTVS